VALLAALLSLSLRIVAPDVPLKTATLEVIAIIRHDK
jgi:hypothetical protein